MVFELGCLGWWVFGLGFRGWGVRQAVILDSSTPLRSAQNDGVGVLSAFRMVVVRIRICWI